MVWAPRRMLVLSTALDTSLSAVNGGHTTISTSLMFASSRLSPLTRSIASATVLFIFQLPAMINLRALFMLRWPEIDGGQLCRESPGSDGGFAKADNFSLLRAAVSIVNAIPLTLTLSHGERGQPAPASVVREVRGADTAPGSVERRRKILPLPEGESRGE